MRCARILSVSLPLAFLLAGCGKDEDAKIETGISSVASHRAAHPHYPVMLLEDFGNDRQPTGISIDAYGYYVHANSKADTGAEAVNQAAASAKVEVAFEKLIQAIVAQEASIPPPKSLPANFDWKSAPHPPQGTYRILCSCGAKNHTFDYAPKSGGDPAAMMSQLKPQLTRDAATVIDDALKAQNESLNALGALPGFTFCTAELLKVQQGSRGVEPHIIGQPYLIVPIDEALALKGVDRSIRKLLSSTAKIQPPPDTANVVVQGPNFDASYPVPLKPGDAQEKGIAAAVAGVGVKIEALNKGSK